MKRIRCDDRYFTNKILGGYSVLDGRYLKYKRIIGIEGASANVHGLVLRER